MGTKNNGPSTYSVSAHEQLDETLITPEDIDSESMAVMNSLAWDNEQAWLSADDLYSLDPGSESTLEAV